MIRWIFVFLWAGVIFYLSSVPNLSSGLESDFVLRKLAHIFVYFILTILIFFALLGDKKISETKNKDILKMSLFAFCLSFLYAISDEYHQTFVFGRNGSGKDVFIDTLGILFATIFNYFKFISRAKNKK
jgi:VanZ family protein